MNNAVVADGKIVRSFCDPFVVLPGQQVVIEQENRPGAPGPAQGTSSCWPHRSSPSLAPIARTSLT